MRGFIGSGSKWSVSFAVLLIATAAMTLHGCLPSLRVRHENARYYEQCHAADLDPQRSTEERRDCWSAWLQHYTRGEPVERVAYARRRRDALGSADGTMPPLPGSAAAENHEATEVPPSVNGAARDGTPQLRDSPEPASGEVRAGYRPPPPFGRVTACTPACNARWDRCMIPCDGRPHACYEACRSRHRTCVATCY